MDFNEVKGWKDKSNIGRRKEINDIINSKSEDFKRDLQSYHYDEANDIIYLNFVSGQIGVPGEFFSDIYTAEDDVLESKDLFGGADMLEFVVDKHSELVEKLDRHKNKISKTKAKIKILEKLLDKYYEIS